MNSVDIRQFSTGSHVNRQCEEQLPVLRIGCLSGIQQVLPYTLRVGWWDLLVVYIIDINPKQRQGRNALPQVWTGARLDDGCVLP